MGISSSLNGANDYITWLEADIKTVFKDKHDNEDFTWQDIRSATANIDNLYIE